MWSRDEATGKTELKRVARTFEKHSSTLVLTFTNGETIETTREHPFFVEHKGFTPAGELGIGTSIVTRAGPNVTLASISTGPTQTVYNFEVEDFHTYFVGKSEVWVHNTCILGKGTLAADMGGTRFRPGQRGVSASKINEYIDAMKNGNFNWNDMDEPILVDDNGVITSGHHRIIAAVLSKTPIPEGIIQRGNTYTGPAIDWSEVWALS